MIYVRLLLKFIRYASTPYWAGYIVAMSNFLFSYNWLLISMGLWRRSWSCKNGHGYVTARLHAIV